MSCRAESPSIAPRMRLRAFTMLVAGLAVACSSPERGAATTTSPELDARSAQLTRLGIRAERPRVIVDSAQNARGLTRIQDESGLAVGFALEGAEADARVEARDGVTLFAGALGGADVAQVTRGDGSQRPVGFA